MASGLMVLLARVLRVTADCAPFLPAEFTGLNKSTAQTLPGPARGRDRLRV